MGGINRRAGLSIVAPVYNEAGLIRNFVERLATVTAKLSDRFEVEIVLVDDGSSDDTLPIMKPSSPSTPSQDRGTAI